MSSAAPKRLSSDRHAALIRKGLTAAQQKIKGIVKLKAKYCCPGSDPDVSFIYKIEGKEKELGNGEESSEGKGMAPYVIIKLKSADTVSPQRVNLLIDKLKTEFGDHVVAKLQSTLLNNETGIQIRGAAEELVRFLEEDTLREYAEEKTRQSVTDLHKGIVERFLRNIAGSKRKEVAVIFSPEDEPTHVSVNIPYRQGEAVVLCNAIPGYMRYLFGKANIKISEKDDAQADTEEVSNIKLPVTDAKPEDKFVDSIKITVAGDVETLYKALLEKEHAKIMMLGKEARSAGIG